MIALLLAFMVAACFASGIALVVMASIGILFDRVRDVRVPQGRGCPRGSNRLDADARTRSG